MSGKQIAIVAALLLAAIPLTTDAIVRGGFSRPSGGFDFHGDGSTYHPPQNGTHSSTGPYGTNRTTTYNNTGNGYNRTTTATNGGYSRTSSGGYNSSSGNAYHSSSGSSPYGSHNSSTSGNTYSGNYNHNGSASNPYGSYNASGSGNYYNRTYSGSGTATNTWGQTYHTGTYANNGYVYHGAAVTNPYYHGVWGWNGGVAWYPAPYYWGGGFWGAFAIGATSAAIYGSIVAANNVSYTSYQVAQQSPGAKLLTSYHLTQTQCGPPNLVVIYGPNNSVICAEPNDLVSAGNYSVNSQTLTLVSESS